jgi:hypothetical protein
MLPGLSPPFFGFDDLDSAELSSRKGCGDVGNLELTESCPHRHQRKQQVYNGKEESMASAVDESSAFPLSRQVIVYHTGEVLSKSMFQGIASLS